MSDIALLQRTALAIPSRDTEWLLTICCSEKEDGEDGSKRSEVFCVQLNAKGSSVRFEAREIRHCCSQSIRRSIHRSRRRLLLAWLARSILKEKKRKEKTKERKEKKRQGKDRKGKKEKRKETSREGKGREGEKG